MVDGAQIWSPIQGNELRFAVNTNWDVFEYPPAKSYFLRVDNAWLVAASIEGPWKAAGKLPDSFTRLPDDDNWTEVKSVLRAKPNALRGLPVVFTSTVPAELILLKGAPVYTAVAGTNLSWVTNTDSDLFRLGQDGPVFYLVSGRWFSAPQFTGPWTFATP